MAKKAEKTEVFGIRLTPTERNRVNREAAKDDRKPSEWARRLILKNLPRPARPSESRAKKLGPVRPKLQKTG